MGELIALYAFGLWLAVVLVMAALGIEAAYEDGKVRDSAMGQ